MTKLQKLLEELPETSSVLVITPNSVALSLIGNKFKHVDTTLRTGIKYDFVFIDNKVINSINLDTIWDNLSYSATLYIDNFNYSQQNSVNTRCIQFIKKHVKNTVISRQMLVNGTTETFMIVKCFPASETNKVFSVPNTKPLIIASVLKTGGIYTAEYVNRLANAVKRNITIPYKFVCITDLPKDSFGENVHQTISFAQNYPKWWGKVELFRNNVFANHRVVYLDLDTLIIDNIDFLYDYTGVFAGLRDFYHMVSLGSGLMCWDGDDKRLNEIYVRFLSNAQSNMTNNPSGDQQWINAITKNYLQYIQDFFPNKILSFKKDCYKNNEIFFPEHASVICFHGSPRMHELESNTKIKTHWY